MKNQGTLSYPLLLQLPAHFRQPFYAEYDDTEGKVKIGQPIIPFLSVLPYSSVSQK